MEQQKLSLIFEITLFLCYSWETVSVTFSLLPYLITFLKNFSELLELKDGRCTPSESVVLGKSLTCKESVIFEDNFNEELIDERKWLIEQYIATSEGQVCVS